MRIVILSSSIYSETACAMAVRLAETGYVPCGALSLSIFDRATLLRKIGQWGVRGVTSYARTRFFRREGEQQLRCGNPYLRRFLERDGHVFHNLSDVGKAYGFSAMTCRDQNSAASITQFRKWAPDLIIFAGGNILRESVLSLPRYGVLNVHLGLLPEVRGMSSPEWSLLKKVPVGITIHYMDSGIDTGPILKRYEYPHVEECESLADLRHRLIAFGIEKLGEIVAAIDRMRLAATSQTDLDTPRTFSRSHTRSYINDNQYFVMHEWMKSRAAECLMRSRTAAMMELSNG